MRAARGRLFALSRKELIQFLRARFMLVLIGYLYTAEVLMCVYALSFDVRDLPTALADYDRSAQSRELIQDFASSGYFKIARTATREPELARLLDRGEVLAAIVIPPEFSQRLAEGEPAAVQFLLDGSNANTASVAQGYAQRIVQTYALAQAEARHPGMALPIDHRLRVWYNSELVYRYFMLLSMIALAGLTVGMVTAAAAVVREKESGTVEQLLVTPVTSTQVVAAKMLPTLIVGLLALIPSLAIAAWVGVPLRGSVALLFLASALYLIGSMGIGILIATATDTLQQALLVSFLVLFPTAFLSGTLVPLESMPGWLQYAAELSPVRHYMDAVLGIFLKGVGLEVLWPRLAAMAAIGAALLGISVWRLKRQLG